MLVSVMWLILMLLLMLLASVYIVAAVFGGGVVGGVGVVGAGFAVGVVDNSIVVVVDDGVDCAYVGGVCGVGCVCGYVVITDVAAVVC